MTMGHSLRNQTTRLIRPSRLLASCYIVSIPAVEKVEFMATLIRRPSS